MGRGGGRGLAVLVELHVAVLLAVTADAAVALCVQERAGVTHRPSLEFSLAKLDGTAAHAQHEPLAVVVQAVGSSAQGRVDVGERHSCGNPLFAGGGRGRVPPELRGLVSCQRGWGAMMFLEGVHAVVSVSGILKGTMHQQTRR